MECCGKWHTCSWFTCERWWFSIAILFYKRATGDSGDRVHPSPILQVIGSQGEASFLLALLQANIHYSLCSMKIQYIHKDGGEGDDHQDGHENGFDHDLDHPFLLNMLLSTEARRYVASRDGILLHATHGPSETPWRHPGWTLPGIASCWQWMILLIIKHPYHNRRGLDRFMFLDVFGPCEGNWYQSIFNGYWYIMVYTYSTWMYMISCRLVALQAVAGLRARHLGRQVIYLSSTPSADFVKLKPGMALRQRWISLPPGGTWWALPSSKWKWRLDTSTP